METWHPFVKRFPTLHLNIFVPNVFNKSNLPKIQDRRLCLILTTQKRVFLQKTIKNDEQ